MVRILRRGMALALVAFFGAGLEPARAADADADACVVAARQKDGAECLACRAYYRNFAHCEHALADYGFARACRAPGASMWREVWCRPKDPSMKSVPASVLASLDDATAGEPHGGAPDAASTSLAADASVASPVTDGAASAPAPSAPPAAGASLDPRAAVVAPKGQASGCGTCAIGRVAQGDASYAAIAAGASVVFAFGARRRRRVTPCTRARSARP